MTAAQKTAKAKFKQAIAYRQKTGVSLKEAFAHIYGKKVGAVKKKPYKGYQYTIDENETGNFVDKYFTLTEAKKDLKKLESNSKKSGKYKKDFYRITDLNSGKTIGAIKKKAAKKVVRKVVKKKAAPKKKVVKKKLTRKDYDKRFQADKPGKRTSASGNTYYESRPNRSDRGKLLGIGNMDSKLIANRYIETLNDINNYTKVLNNIKNSYYGLTSLEKIRAKVVMAKFKKIISELKTHSKELKKNL